MVVFSACLFIFWFSGFRQRPFDEFQKQLPITPTATSSTGWWFSKKQLKKELKSPTVQQHPIPQLMEEAQRKFSDKLARQSKTLSDAVVEYRRRYKREPPKGFDDWWEFAKRFNVQMVDEYDILMEDLAPFYDLSGWKFGGACNRYVGTLPSIDLVRVTNGVVEVLNMRKGFRDSEVSARARGFRSMMGKFASTLPDMDFPINAKAEGRVLIPWEHRQYPNLTKADSSGGVDEMLGGYFDPDWRDDGTVWNAWRRTCPLEAPARRLYSKPGPDFEFQQGTSADFDYCANPHQHYTQGHFFADWRTIPVLYPVFSPARAKGYMDIRIPSHYYYGSTSSYTYGWDRDREILLPIDPMEIPWAEKSDKMFWRGATTGGGSHPPGFSPQYQRHRFLRMTSDQSNKTRIVTFPDPEDPSKLTSVSIPSKQLNEEITDAAFVKVSGLYPGGLKALMETHRTLVDLDGMSYSGRFLSFLASDSVPVKATVYTEFFSDWIQPWLHFIPLSSSYKELYNIHSFFSGPTQSMLEAANSTLATVPLEERPDWPEDESLRKIALEGKHWKRTIGRTLDMEVYVYRLCLEWARLWADNRDSMNYVLSGRGA
ncbi:capsular associated protein [Coprinopsis sp. MPI-PUGE-AT-0042]|nr:capsular associated protein [Coprinopsis sp. MPI-PUGE-AT-0042]